MGCEIENVEDWEASGGDEDCDLDINYDIDFEQQEDKAIFNLNTYMANSRATGARITNEYDCGREGCFAGWYCMMGREKGFLDDHESREVALYNIQLLSRHFGIAGGEALMLFSSLGKGAEGFPSDEFDEFGQGIGKRDLNADALAARSDYLDSLFERYEIDTNG